MASRKNASRSTTGSTTVGDFLHERDLGPEGSFVKNSDETVDLTLDTVLGEPSETVAAELWRAGGCAGARGYSGDVFGCK